MNRKKHVIKSRRGVESVVGGFFFLVLMVGTFSTILTVMAVQNNILHDTTAESNRNNIKVHESFTIAASLNNKNKISVLAFNTGTNGIQMTDLWIINQTGTFPARLWPINYTDAFVPYSAVGNITATQNLIMQPGYYIIKVATKLGTVQSNSIYVPPLGTPTPTTPAVDFFSTNKATSSGDDVRLIMVITNNGASPLTNVNATLPSISPSAMKSGLVLPILPQGNQTLRPGESLAFQWHFTIAGAVGSTARASSTVTGTNPGLSVVTIPVSTQITINQESRSADILDKSAAPKLYMIYPGPIGTSSDHGSDCSEDHHDHDDENGGNDNNHQDNTNDNCDASSSGKGVYATILANPSNTTITVNKISMHFITPRISSSDKMIQKSGGDDSQSSTLTQILPTSGWSVPDNNIITWTGSVTIPPRSSGSFIVKASAGNIADRDLSSFTISAQAFTNIGEFTKNDYSSDMVKTSGAVPNVYLSTLPNSTAGANISGHRNGVQSNSIQTFNFVLADMDSASSTKINSGATLAIYVPAGFTNIVITGSGGFTTPTITTHSDGSSIITASTTVDLTGSGSQVARTIQFTATAPTVTSKQIYVFYALTGGTINTSMYPLAARAEVPVQVVP